MRIMIDQSPKVIAEFSEKYNMEFWQLRTPLTAYALAGVPYGLDNGCFTSFDRKTWTRLVAEALDNPPVFVCLPDIVGDARRTIELFDIFLGEVKGLPPALVLQDGVGDFPIPWEKINAVFVGGSDAFKVSKDAIAACKMAKILGKWVHVGRVNTVDRLNNWIGIADSIDGTGLIKDETKLERIVKTIKGENPQLKLIGACEA